MFSMFWLVKIIVFYLEKVLADLDDNYTRLICTGIKNRTNIV